MADLEHPDLGADDPKQHPVVADAQLPVPTKRASQRRAVLLRAARQVHPDGAIETSPDILR